MFWRAIALGPELLSGLDGGNFDLSRLTNCFRRSESRFPMQAELRQARGLRPEFGDALFEMAAGELTQINLVIVVPMPVPDPPGGEVVVRNSKRAQVLVSA